MNSPNFQGQSAVLVIQVMAKDNKISMPKATFQIKTDQSFKIAFQLPIFNNKFFQKRDLAMIHCLTSIEDQCRNFPGHVFAYDAFLQYPAPVSVPCQEVMKKVGSLLS